MIKNLARVIGLSAAFYAAPAAACGPPPALLMASPEVVLRGVEADSAPYLSAIDAYAGGLEACYDGPLGPLELAPHMRAADALAARLALVSLAAENRVRGNEFDYEALLSSSLWTDLEALRVAAAYAAAWGQLAGAVRHVAAEDKKQALLAAQKQLRQLGFEFKHPVLVQRAMYGLATAQIEAGQLADAKATLKRLQASLQRGGSAAFKTAIADFLARISAPGYQPPTALFTAPEKPSGEAGFAAPGSGGGTGGGDNALDVSLANARQALREARPADEIARLLEPAMTGTPQSAQSALALAARDQTILDAMSYEPGPSLRVMRLAFEGQKYGQIVAVWPDIKPYYRLMPEGLKRQVDYRLGVARLNLGALDLAIDHLRAAQKGLSDSPLKTRIGKLIVLARLSVDKAPNEARLTLAKANLKPPQSVEVQNPKPLTPAEALDNVLDLRARIVLARHASAQEKWAEADKWLTGIGPEQDAYQLFLGMRVRLLAQALKGRQAAGDDPKKLLLTARGAQILYRIWRNSECPPGCLTGDRLAVHRAAIESALIGGLDSTGFGYSWGGFVEDGGDILPLTPRAVRFLTLAADTERLMALLEPSDETLAAQVLLRWKNFLTEAQKDGVLERRYDWLADGLPDLQGRPRAVLLENLVRFDLQRDAAKNALRHAEALAAGFPRRPAAWFLRAAALQANQRHIEAARALSALAQRTPADDPVGMGARLGLAAVFVGLERGEQACAMRAKIFSRPQAPANWREAVKAFPVLADWHQATASCGG